MGRSFRVRGRDVPLSGPSLMAIVNASPESFSGDGRGTLPDQASAAEAAFGDGALTVDLGGQSANTSTPELAVDEEIDRLVPLVRAIRQRHRGLLSIDTYKPAVAEACLEAGADIINDVSGLLYPETAEVTARHGGAYVLMHTVGEPKTKVLDPDLYPDVVASVLGFFDQKTDVLAAAGLDAAQVVLDPGIDFGKTPRQSLDLIARAGELYAATDRPLLFAISRKDVVGAITATPPRERDPGTLALLGHLAAVAPASLFRVHDVRGARQYLDVLDHLSDPDLLAPESQLDIGLRRDTARG